MRRNKMPSSTMLTKILTRVVVDEVYKKWKWWETSDY